MEITVRYFKNNSTTYNFDISAKEVEVNEKGGVTQVTAFGDLEIYDNDEGGTISKEDLLDKTDGEFEEVETEAGDDEDVLCFEADSNFIDVQEID